MRLFDYSLLAKRPWSSETLGYVAQIREHRGKQEAYLAQKPAALDRLVDLAKIQSTESSNRIEGIITTDSRFKQLYQGKTTPRSRDEKEIMGYRDVLNLIHEQYAYIPLQSGVIRQLHRDLYRYSEKAMGGQYKQAQNYIMETHQDGTQAIRFLPLAPYETPEAMDKACASFSLTLSQQLIDPLVLIPAFIHDFLCIHPFSDGNGRMSRLLTTLLLYQSDFLVGRYISLENKIERTKEHYYDALAISGIGWQEGQNDPSPFINYLLGTILAAYRDLEERIALLHTKQPAYDMVKEAALSTLGSFTKSELLERIPGISKASVENALSRLVREGLLTRHGKGPATHYTWGSEMINN